MPRWHNHYEDGHAHFCTLTVANWRPLLTGKNIDTLYDVWSANRQKLSVRILAYVIMPEHFHIVLWSERGKDTLEFMQCTSSLVSKRLQPGGGFWKERPRVLPVYSDSVLRVKVEYIHNNPMRRELSECADGWPHSSFRQLVLGHTDVPFVCDSWDVVSI